jgi:hypothetical protein
MTSTGALFLAGYFGPSTAERIFITSLANDKQDQQFKPRSVTTRDPEILTGFFYKHDLPGRATYFCVNTLKKGATNRNKNTIAELNGLHVDIDFKSVNETPEQVLNTLQQCSPAPTTVVASGHGYHAYWLLRQSITADAESIQHIEFLLHRLADVFGGDHEPAHVAALMRVVGTHNSKNGDNIEIVCVIDNPLARYDVEQLETWLNDPKPLLHRKPVPNGNGADHNPFVTIATAYGFKPPIDVEQRLAQMTYQGPDDSAIHQTQLQVSASLLNGGTPVDAVVELLLERTREVAGAAGTSWNWDVEETNIRRMCEDWLKKNPSLNEQPGGSNSPPPPPDPPPGPETGEEQPDDDDGGVVLNLAKAKKQKSQRLKNISGTMISIISDGVIEALRKRNQDLLLSDGEIWLYRDGVWELPSAGIEQRLRVLINTGADVIKNNDPKVINGAWKRLIGHPEIYRLDIPWDPPGVIAVGNGTLNLVTREFSEWDQHHFVHRKVTVEYHKDATCSQFLKFIGDAFANYSNDEAEKILACIQEFFGASMCVNLLARQQRRGMILDGPSNSGKSELARMLQRLIGEPIASQSVTDIGETFGLAPFIGARAWIRDDAANEGDKLDPQRYKLIVTGEAVAIRCMRQAARRFELNIPVLLTVNSLPTARDTSDAIFNRSLIIRMSMVFTEESAIITRQELQVPPAQKYIADTLFDREGSGILNWALDGLDRLLKRGR